MKITSRQTPQGITMVTSSASLLPKVLSSSSSCLMHTSFAELAHLKAQALVDANGRVLGGAVVHQPRCSNLSTVSRSKSESEIERDREEDVKYVSAHNQSIPFPHCAHGQLSSPLSQCGHDSLPASLKKGGSKG